MTSLVCPAATPSVHLPPAEVRHRTGHPARMGTERCEADMLTPVSAAQVAGGFDPDLIAQAVPQQHMGCSEASYANEETG
jgi:hypothetical protein